MCYNYFVTSLMDGWVTAKSETEHSGKSLTCNKAYLRPPFRIRSVFVRFGIVQFVGQLSNILWAFIYQNCGWACYRYIQFIIELI